MIQIYETQELLKTYEMSSLVDNVTDIKPAFVFKLASSKDYTLFRTILIKSTLANNDSIFDNYQLVAIMQANRCSLPNKLLIFEQDIQVYKENG